MTRAVHARTPDLTAFDGQVCQGLVRGIGDRLVQALA